MHRDLRGFLRRLVGTFTCGDAGTAAIEFAFIAPVLIAVVLMVTDVADIAKGASNMQTAIRAGVQYAINGGSDMSVAQAQVTQAWDDQPSGASSSAVKSCTCAGAAHDCNTPCADGTVPAIFVTVSASATLGGQVVHVSKSLTEKIQIR